jgi:septal ring-binding cell division protein DamX
VSTGTTETPSPEQPPAPQPDACPNCGAPLPPGQDWCLNCGAPARTRIAHTPNWRLPVAIVGVLVVLLGAAVAVAFVQLSDDSKDVGNTDSVASAPTTTTATTPTLPTTPGSTTPTVPGATTTPTVPGSTTPTTPGSTTTPTVPGETTPTIPEATGGSNEAGTPHKPTPNPTPARIASWPAGRSAYTAVLMSATSKGEADAKAKSLAGRGVDVGVLHSNDFSSLEPGYWVVFSGHYPGLAPAQAAAQRLAKQGAPGAYGRLVKP